MRMHNHEMGSYLQITILSCIIISISLTSSYWQMETYCYDTGNFTKNSAYDQNRNTVFASLAFNVKAKGGLLYSSVGEDPNKIYVVASCSGDSSAEDCASCVNATAQDIITHCPNQKEAISWGPFLRPPCTTRYANRPLFGKLELEPCSFFYKVENITSINMKEFDKIWKSIMNQTLKKATMGSSRLKFATGQADLTSFQKIYTRVQCSPDLSPTDCDYCLVSSVDYYQSCCHGRGGGSIRRPSCNFRWEMYPFYDATDEAPTTSPPTAAGPSIPPAFTENVNITKDLLIRKGGKGRQVGWIAIVTTVSASIVLVVSCYFLRRMWRKNKEEKAKRKALQLLRLEDDSMHSIIQGGQKQVESQEFPLLPLDQVLEATGHFSNENKLGEGGFGPVYKGVLADGKEIAVKRLSRSSGQGLKEFKNEVTLIAKLQHKNLVRLLGCCLERDELLLVYEYMPNKSLDVHLFDSTKSIQVDWKRRISIINGIARGLLYLHEDSRLKIIHRDLKTSNILLDHEMNPKISDFGLAKIFNGNQNEANTNRVVGTYGYMAPEYAMEGIFSVKSDVFSFGVLLLEIISGRKNTGFYLSEHGRSLLAYAWKLWCEGQALELMDPVVVQSCVTVELLKLIHIGLLCVQEDPADRPTMSSVVLMMGSDPITLPKPKQPAFSVSRVVEESSQSPSDSKGCSVNGVTLSNVTPR